MIEFWDVQPLVRILGFGRRHYVLESSCNDLHCLQEISDVQEICGLTKDYFSRRTRQRMRFALCCSAAHDTIRQRSPVHTAVPPLAGNAEYIRTEQRVVWLQSKTKQISFGRTKQDVNAGDRKHGMHVGA